jgi:phage shock protein PspC (stress-responsive transcriptional regulator)
MAKRLYRSTTNRTIWGVCGGLGEYFGMDPVLVRVIFVVLALASGVGFLLYIILAIVTSTGSVPATVSPEGIQQEETERSPQEASRGAMVAGAVLVALGLLFLLSNLGLFWWLSWGNLWPLILIAFGVAVFLGRWGK